MHHELINEEFGLQLVFSELSSKVVMRQHSRYSEETEDRDKETQRKIQGQQLRRKVERASQTAQNTQRARDSPPQLALRWTWHAGRSPAARTTWPDAARRWARDHPSACCPRAAPLTNRARDTVTPPPTSSSASVSTFNVSDDPPLSNQTLF